MICGRLTIVALLDDVVFLYKLVEGTSLKSYG